MKRGQDDVSNEDGVGALLREVDRRDEPSAAEIAEVRTAVQGEWRATVTQRKRRRRVIAFATAASIAFVTIVASWVKSLAITRLTIVLIAAVSAAPPPAIRQVLIDIALGNPSARPQMGCGARSDAVRSKPH